MRFLYLIAPILLLLAIPPACGGDDSKGSKTQNDTDGGTGDSGSGTCEPAAADGGCGDTKVFDGKCCIDKTAGITVCKDNSVAAVPGTKTDDPTCGAGCTCEKCTQQMLDCGNDPDKYCQTILQCAQEHNCTGVGCYAMTTCQTIIDNAPGGGLTAYSVALATAISDCAVAAGCAASCP